MLPCFPKWLCHFTFPLVAYESSSSFLSSPTLNRFNTLFFSFFFFPIPFMATLKAYGSSLANPNPRHSCNLHCSWGNTGSFNPLHWAGDQTCTSAETWAAAVSHCARAGSLGPSFFFFFFVFLGLHQQYMEVPKLRGWIRAVAAPQLQQQGIQAAPVTYTTVHGNTWILNPLSEARDQSYVLRILAVSFPLIPNGNSWINLFLKFLAIPLCGWHCVIILLICICLVTINIEHPSICLFTINICSQKVSLKTFWLYFLIFIIEF